MGPERDDRQIGDNIFKCVFVNKNHCILIQFSLVYLFCKHLIDNKDWLSVGVVRQQSLTWANVYQDWISIRRPYMALLGHKVVCPFECVVCQDRLCLPPGTAFADMD